jgi:hypothetical protein
LLADLRWREEEGDYCVGLQRRNSKEEEKNMFDLCDLILCDSLFWSTTVA